MRSSIYRGSILAAALFMAAAALGQTITPLKAPHPPQPYTAEFKTTHVQVLANGTTITRETTSTQARDSQGRTLFSNEISIPNLGTVTNTTVSDPVESTRVQWSSRMKTATIEKLPPPDQRNGCWQSDTGSIRKSYPDSAGRTGMVSVQTGTVQGMIVESNGPVNGTASPSVPGPVVSGQKMVRPHIDDLGTANIQGVEVRGSRVIRTTPAGAVGNDQPMVSATETWFSPEYGFVVKQITDNPRMGKTTRELVSFTPGDPDPAVFQPPQGYDVETVEFHQVPCQQPR